MNSLCRMSSWLCTFALAGSALGPANTAVAQSYPTKPVRIIVATGGGSNDDTITRLIAPKLTDALGQQFFAENRPGAAGMIGQTMAASAPPDGYTLLYAGGSMAGSRFVNANFKLDVLRDLSPISLLQTGKYFLVIHPSVQVRNLKEYIALARANPGRMTYVTTGAGQAPYWDAVLFNSMAGIKAVEVPYKVSAEGLVDVIAGRVDYYFVGSAAAVANKARLRVLAVTTTTRSTVFPDVPTIDEAGVPGYDMPSWGSLVGPGGMRADIVNTLNAAVVRALNAPDVRDRILAMGNEPAPSSPAEIARRFTDWAERYGKIAKLAGIKPQ
jgi:tripartite-type tricarboxylate transporter receptor subunit TctC